jgi:hypothetical protein
VAFDVVGLRSCVADDDVAAMFGLELAEAPSVASVVLSSEGRRVYRHDDPHALAREPLAPALVECLDAIATDGVACIGLAAVGARRPVAMSARVAVGEGCAEAAFTVPPDGLGAVRPMLAAVGIRPVKVSQVGALVRVEFAFDLRRHIESARLARFGRTLSCVDFFADGVPPAGQVERGLRDALRARLRRGSDRVRELAASLVESGRALTMTARAPQAWDGRTYGDVVPDGVLLAGLRVITGGNVGAQLAACAVLRQRLIDTRAAGGWAFHRGTLPTATDSAPVLLGLRDTTAVDDLERYADRKGGYVPQLSSEAGDAEHMARSPATVHWDQPDMFTTCLIRHLRRQVGLPATTPTQWIRDRLATRSGLYNAGPWLVDMAVALEVADDPDAVDIRRIMRRELLAARNDDGSFGRARERPLATAAAVCALRALGVRGRVLGEKPATARRVARG